MNLLYANDTRGQYPASWYAATAEPLEPFPHLEGPLDVDLCIIGGGFTGLSAALAAQEAGIPSIALLDAQRLGFGASGRNGGQVGSGQRVDQDVLEDKYGMEAARALWNIAQDAKAEIKRLIAKHQIEADWRDGVAFFNWTEDGARETQDYARHLQQVYDADFVEPLGKAGLPNHIRTAAYEGGMVDWTSGHIHPLRFCLGLARALGPGIRIHEQTEVLGIAPKSNGWRVATPLGVVSARRVLLATNGYDTELRPETRSRVMPINNYIIATEPLGDLAQELLPSNVAVADSRFVINYFRRSADGRLLFGGGESYGDRFPKDIAAIARKPMLEVFPQLKDVRIDYAWGGTLGITATRLPYFAELKPGLWTAGGYSGQGVALATLGGRLCVEAMLGQRDRFERMHALRPPAFPGLGLIRRPLLNLAMRWGNLSDRKER